MSKPAVESIEIIACRGISGGNCRFAIQSDNAFPAAIRNVVEQTGWDAFLRSQINGPLLHHHTLKISVAACPNGCSRPHVADIGIIRAKQPELVPDTCSHCGLCGRICPDKAISYDKGEPVFDLAQCMKCGMCMEKCPERAIRAVEDGYRVVLGGKLGRHPRLASELGGIFCEKQVLAIVAECVFYYMEQYRPKLRFGTLVEENYESLMQRLDPAKKLSCKG
ncbi:4Fe-4S binding protein [Halodesulfovibrio aestuarii]|uniref:4Fe-4S binding protein n=1 Tax=Halodesulfovibrio aestuarii TaxID=126333 RepID=UPI003522C7A3